MAYDFKKEFKELYRPKTQPGIVEVPQVYWAAAESPESLACPRARYGWLAACAQLLPTQEHHALTGPQQHELSGLIGCGVLAGQ